MKRSALEEAKSAVKSFLSPNIVMNSMQKGERVADWPSYQTIQAQGGFNPPPGSINLNKLGTTISNTGNAIKNAVLGTYQMFNKPAIYKFDFKSPSLSPTPPPKPPTTVSPEGFRFIMNQSIFEWTKPLLLKLFTE